MFRVVAVPMGILRLFDLQK